MNVYYHINNPNYLYIPLINYSGDWWYAVVVISEKATFKQHACIGDIKAAGLSKTDDSVLSVNQKMMQ